MALYELAYTEKEIAEKFLKIDSLKDDNSYPIMFRVGENDYYVAPSGYTWKELYALGIYRWLYVGDEGVYINNEGIGAPQEDEPIDQYWYNEPEEPNENYITIYIDGDKYTVPSGMTFQELMDAGEIPVDDHYMLDDGNYNYITDEYPVEGESYTHTSV